MSMETNSSSQDSRVDGAAGGILKETLGLVRDDSRHLNLVDRVKDVSEWGIGGLLAALVP